MLDRAKRWLVESRIKCYPSTESRTEQAEHALNWFANSLRDRAGSSAKYSLLSGQYYPSYPETTGYWLSTLYDAKGHFSDIYRSVFGQRPVIDDLVSWLRSVQRNDGAFPASYGSDCSGQPRVFNTGQIVLGLLSHYRATRDEKTLQSMLRAAEWLTNVQSEDGSWTRYSKGQLSSNTRTAWSLIELGLLTNEDRYTEAGIRNIEFSLSLQTDGGYFRLNGFDGLSNAFTHTIAYSLRGILEASMLLEKRPWQARTEKGYRAIVQTMGPEGLLAGRFNENLSPDGSFVCLTGSCQMSIIGYKLSNLADDPFFLETSKNLLGYVRRRQLASDDPGIDGGISGSWPIRGSYNAYEIPNWAVKFFVDALIIEDRLLF